MKFNFTFENQIFWFFFNKNSNFLLKCDFFEILCLRWIRIFKHDFFFDVFFRQPIFFSQRIIESRFIILHLSFKNVIWKITTFKFFFSIDMKINIINQKSILRILLRHIKRVKIKHRHDLLTNFENDVE